MKIFYCSTKEAEENQNHILDGGSSRGRSHSHSGKRCRSYLSSSSSYASDSSSDSDCWSTIESLGYKSYLLDELSDYKY